MKSEWRVALAWVVVMWLMLAAIIWTLLPYANASPYDPQPGCFRTMTCDPNVLIACPDGRLITVYGACPQLITGPEGPTLPGAAE